jgi:hypothetical protein
VLLALYSDWVASVIPTIAREIEGENAVAIGWPSQHLRMAERAYRIVITGAPMILHG